jgi:hypothetical protein
MGRWKERQTLATKQPETQLTQKAPEVSMLIVRVAQESWTTRGKGGALPKLGLQKIGIVGQTEIRLWMGDAWKMSVRILAPMLRMFMQSLIKNWQYTEQRGRSKNDRC